MGSDSAAQFDCAGRTKATVNAFVPVICAVFPQKQQTETE